MEKTTTEQKKDRVKWYFDAEARLASLTISDKTESYDLSKVIPMDASQNIKALAFFGFKQWVASNFASFKDDAGKINSAREDYDDLVAAGLELIKGEKGVTYMKVVGKTTVKGERCSTTKAHLNSQVWSYEELLTLQKAKIPFTPEMAKAFMDLKAAKEAAEDLNATLKGKKK